MNCLRKSSRTFASSSGSKPLNGATAAGRVFLSALAIVLLVAVATQAKEFTFDYQRILETGFEAEVNLTYVSGDLEITGSDDGRVVIDAVKRVDAVSIDEAQIVADHIEIKVRHDKQKVDIAANYLQMRNRGQSFWQKTLGIGGSDSFGEVDWKIKVPRGCRVTVQNTSGQAMISHVVGNVTIRSSAAEITLLSIEGNIEIESSSGTTAGELLFGSVTVRQAQGKIDLRYVEGDVRIKSSTADINLVQDRGSLDLVTATGNATVQTNLDGVKDSFVETESGNITLTIPETSSGNLRIQSQTGEIRTDIPISIKSMTRRQVEGRFGAGGVTVNLVSVSGNVTVAQF